MGEGMFDFEVMMNMTQREKQSMPAGRRGRKLRKSIPAIPDTVE
jgi:hypothetical protein